MDIRMKIIERLTVRLLLALAMLGTVMLNSSVEAHAEEQQPKLHHLSAAACGECHQEIYDQWAGSMHAQSTALSDPIHGVFYKMLMGSPTEEGLRHKKSGQYPVCLKCHAPNAARDGKTKLDAMEAYQEGVNCVVCHTMERFKGVDKADGKGMNLGSDAYVFSDSRLQGGRGVYNGATPVAAPGSGGIDTSVNPYPHANNPEMFKTSNVCMGCHEKRNNGHGVPVCAIEPEIVGGKGAPDVNCQFCHMPVVDGVTSHAMLGGHDAAMLQRAITVGLSVSGEEGALAVEVTLANQLLHQFPNGAPFRNAFLKVSAFDDQGKMLWRNYAKSPFSEDPGAVMMLKLVGDDDKPAPPPKATKIADDSRLKPGEVRKVYYEVKEKGIKSVRAEVYYNLLLPPLLKKFDKQLPDSVKKPVLVGRADVQL